MVAREIKSFASTPIRRDMVLSLHLLVAFDNTYTPYEFGFH